MKSGRPETGKLVAFVVAVATPRLASIPLVTLAAEARKSSRFEALGSASLCSLCNKLAEADSD